MAKIIAPNKEYNGISAGVQFKSGVGHTENENLIRWFESKGYVVEKPAIENVVSETTNDPVVKPKRKGR